MGKYLCHEVLRQPHFQKFTEVSRHRLLLGRESSVAQRLLRHHVDGALQDGVACLGTNSLKAGIAAQIHGACTSPCNHSKQQTTYIIPETGMVATVQFLFQ